MYFDAVSESALPLFKEEIGPSMVGCYTSQVRIKQMHRLLENMLYQTEKLLSVAQLYTGASGDWKALDQAEETLLFNEFHDILPGTSVQCAEEAALRDMEVQLPCLRNKGHGHLYRCADRQGRRNRG